MDTEVLRWFQQVADGVTLTEVSDLESVTQSGVSRALARLETEVGTPLLRRSGRTLRMTNAGAAFKRHVDALLHQLDDGLAAVNQLIDPERGTVSVAFQHSLGSWLVPSLISSFLGSHPDIHFVLSQSGAEARAAGLRGGRVDLELGTRGMRDPSVHTRAIATDPLRIAVSVHHPFARRARMRLAELSGQPFVGLRPGAQLRDLADELCERAGFEPDVQFSGDDLAIVRGFVAAGLGVAIVPAPRHGAPDSGMDELSYIEITDVGAYRQISMTWSAERRMLPAAELFRQHIVARTTAGDIPAVLG